MNNKSSKNKSASKNNNTMEQMKYEIADEFGVSLGADASSRENGSVGGEMTKRLVNMGQISKPTTITIKINNGKAVKTAFCVLE